MNIYETDPLLDQYLLFHYGSAEEIMPWPGGPFEALDFPKRTAELLADAVRKSGGAESALDVGCAVGRSAFELARICRRVLALDYSQRFVDAAERIRTEGKMDYRIAVEGTITMPAVAMRPEGVEPARVIFETGDACALPESLGGFDLVHAANLIDRLQQPALFLARAAGLVKAGGFLLITSPYTWMDAFTPEAHWIGGREGVSTFEGLQQHLGAAFEWVSTSNEPFLIREHARKYQWSMAEATLWRRRVV